MPERIGEVIESSTTGFTAGAYELLRAPPFGALVRAQARAEGVAVYGLVYDIRTGSKEPGGRALVRGRTYEGRELFDAEIYHEHPDLAEVLQTEFSAITVGFVEGGRTYQYLPPHPPPVHYSVYECAGPELVHFCAQSDFFRTLLFASHIPSDELLAAVIRAAARAHPGEDGRAYLVQAGREVASLLKDDYDRLTAILRRIRP
ncbi:MAG TPA: HAS-barrel domain-containing protein [Roseiflexaceae bacterium]|nr:HAS-barrel domain-containing protein [Roseiflexaceae bacterium]